MQPTVDELRELSRRTRREQRRAALALSLTGILFPALALVWVLRPGWLVGAAYAATGAAGLLFVAYAHAAGQTRGAFRRVFRRLKDARKTA